MKMLLAYLSILLLLAPGVKSAALGKDRKEHPTSRSFYVHNESGRRFDVLWIDTIHQPPPGQPNARVSNNGGEGYPYGGEVRINSFIGHEFDVVEMPSKKTNKCKYDKCRVVSFEVTAEEDQVITVDKNFTLTRTDKRTEVRKTAHTLVSKCQEKISNSDKKTATSMSGLEKVDALTTCIESSLNETLKEKEEEHDFQSNLRENMASQLVPYACNDFEFNTTEEVQNVTFRYRFMGGTSTYKIKLIHERPSSVILAVENFATISECQAIKRLLGPKSRTISWTTLTAGNKKDDDSEDLWYLSDAIYTIARNYLELDDDDFDFEKLVQTKAGGTQPMWLEVLDDESHDISQRCDDSTSSALVDKKCLLPSQHKFVDDDSLLATAFISCDKVPDGGAIHFPFAGVHINPKPGLLIFAAHRTLGEPFDGFVQDYHLCPHHNYYVQEIFADPMYSSSEMSGQSDDRDEL